MDEGQDDHQDFVNAISQVRGPVIISPFVVAELDYMILREYGREDQIAFLDQVQSGAYHLETFTEINFTRAWRLVFRVPLPPVLWRGRRFQRGPRREV